MRLWDRIETRPGIGSRSRLLGMLLMVWAAMSWAGIEFLGSLIPRDYSPYETVWVRYGAHLIFMILVLGRVEGFNMFRTPRLGRQIFRSLLMLGMPACFITAVSLGVDLRLVWAITWISVPMMMLIASILLGEKVTMARWIAGFVGLAGTLLFIRPPFVKPGWKLLLPLGVGFCYGLYNVLTRAMRTERTSANLFHTALWVFIPLTFVMPSVWHTPTLKVALAMVGIGVWGFVTLLALDRALAWAPVSAAAPFIYTQCIWTDFVGVIWHRFHPVLHQLLGAVLIVGSLIWILAQDGRGNLAVQPRTGDTP